MHAKPIRPWSQVTRLGVPLMAVIRRPLNTGTGEPLPVGAVYPEPDPKNFGQLRRTRHYYEARRIAVADQPVATNSDIPAPVVISPDLALLPQYETKPVMRPVLPGKRGGK